MNVPGFERFTLLSDSPPDVVAARLAANVSSWGASARATAPFVGYVEGRRFEVVWTPLIPVKNWWVANGELLPAPAGTEIAVHIRPQVVGLAALMALGLGIALSLAGGVAMVIADLGWNGASGHYAVGLAMCGSGVVLAAFAVGASRSAVQVLQRTLCDQLGCRVAGAGAPPWRAAGNV